MSPALYVCATPIGNLSDVTARLLETLRQVAVIAAEDTRVTQKLLQRFDIGARVISLRQQNEVLRSAEICRYLSEGQSVAYVSDAGTPGLCDPGQQLVRLVRDAGYPVVPIPGPSAVATFLSVAGFFADQWIFGGFFPRKFSEALPYFQSAQRLRVPLIFFESPMRIHETMSAILSGWALEKVAFGKELTKQFEAVWSGAPEAALAALQQYPQKGEWVFAVVPAPVEKGDLVTTVETLREAGLSKAQIVSLGKTCFGFSRNEIYSLLLTMEETGGGLGGD